MGNKEVAKLYNLKKDLGEKNNIVKETPKQVERLKKKLDKMKSSH